MKDKTFAGTNTSQDHVEDLKKEFNLSEKIVYDEWGDMPGCSKAIIAGHKESIDLEFVKEFIKVSIEDLKEEGNEGVEDFDEDTLAFSLADIKKVLNKRAGDKLYEN